MAEPTEIDLDSIIDRLLEGEYSASHGGRFLWSSPRPKYNTARIRKLNQL